MTRFPIPLRGGLGGLYCVLGLRDRLGILLVYHPPCCVPTVSLPELTEVVSDMVLRTPRLLVLGDLNIHAQAALTGAGQDFIAAMTTMELFQCVIGLTHEKGHTLDMVSSTGLDVEGLVLTPL